MLVEPRTPDPSQSNSDLLAGYALGILTPAELAAVEAELAASPAAADELAMLTFAVDAIPLAEAPREPSAALRQRLETAVRAELPAVAPPAPLTLPPAVTWNPARAPEPREPAPGRALPPPRAFPFNVWAFAAAAMLLVAIGALGWGLQQRQALEPVRTVAFTMDDSMPGAAGEIQVMTQPEPMLMLSVDNLPALAADQVYEVWLIPNEGAPIPAGTFTDTSVRHAMTGEASAYQAVAMTVEPGPLGTTAPSTDPFAVASLAAE